MIVIIFRFCVFVLLFLAGKSPKGVSGSEAQKTAKEDKAFSFDASTKEGQKEKAKAEEGIF